MASNSTTSQPCWSLLDFFHLEGNIDADGHATFGGLQGRAQPKQVVAVEQDLPLSLEEIYNGTTRKLKISKRVSRGVVLAVVDLRYCLSGVER